MIETDKIGPLLIGIDIGGTNIQIGIVTPTGKLIERKTTPTMVHEGRQQVIDRLCTLIKDYTGQYTEGSIKGIGIGCAGAIDTDQGIVVTSPNFPGWENVPLKQIISEKFGIKTLLDNDANVVVFGEFLFGAGRGASSLIGLTLGTGVGGGIILDGNIWSGCEGMAGEIGHMTIVPDGLPCNCGNVGCLEAYTSATAIVNRTKMRISKTPCHTLLDAAGIENPEGLTAATIYRAARAGEKTATAILKETGMYLGIGLASLINIFNPEMIVIGGGVINAWEFFHRSMFNEVQRRAFKRPAQIVKILPAKLGNEAGILGAAGLIVKHLP